MLFLAVFAYADEKAPRINDTITPSVINRHLFGCCLLIVPSSPVLLTRLPHSFGDGVVFTHMLPRSLVFTNVKAVTFQPAGVRRSS